jgi:hypothetical protein
MEPARIAALLGIVEDQISLTQAGIDAQRSVVAQMRGKHYATGDAETHLTVLEASLAVHLAERQRLRAELAALRPH